MSVGVISSVPRTRLRLEHFVFAFAILSLIVLVVLPLCSLLLGSVRGEQGLSFDNFAEVVSGRLYVSALKNSLILGAWTDLDSSRHVFEVKGLAVDPPRQGAQAQVHQLAKSKIPVVAAVSCNAVTFARDARILIDGGYRIERVTPVDQFRHTPHVELVARFARKR